MSDRNDLTVYRLTAADLDAHAGRELSEDELERVGKALDNSLGEDIATIIDSVCT